MRRSVSDAPKRNLCVAMMREDLSGGPGAVAWRYFVDRVRPGGPGSGEVAMCSATSRRKGFNTEDL